MVKESNGENGWVFSRMVGFFQTRETPLIWSLRYYRHSFVRVYHSWNSWYFLMEIYGIQISPVLVPLWVLTKRVSLYFSPWTFCFKTKQIQQHQISGKWENVVEEETEVGSWSRYIALASYKNINNNVTFHNRKKNGVTRRVPLVEQGLLTFPNHPLSSPVFSGVHVARSLALYVAFGR